VVEELERDEPATNADGQPDGPDRTRERGGEGTGILFLGCPELMECRGPGAPTGPRLAAADFRPDLALVGGKGMRRGRAGSSDLVDAAALLADLGVDHRAQGVVGFAAGPETGRETGIPAPVLEAGDRQLGDLAG